ncbi:MAG: hypothetical protein KC933_12945 [Myxococcales bacterium]|nr:hypothetical protein [Myxococcales bacterium]
MRVVAVLSALLAPSLAGCGVVAQSVAGWREVVEVNTQDVARVDVQTVPLGAEVCRKDSYGGCGATGQGPWVDEVPVQVHFRRSEPRYAWLVMGMIADFVAVGTLVAVADKACESDTCTGVTVGGALGGMLSGMVDMGTLIFGLLRTAHDVGPREIVRPTEVTYRAEKPEYAPARADLELELQSSLRLDLTPLAVEAPTAVAFDRARAVLAVLPVTGAGPDDVRASLQDRLRAKVVGSGLRTADRGLTDAALRDAACTTSDCAVDVGRALAASHLLRAGLEVDGNQACALRLELVDLATEAVVSAAVAEGPCGDFGALDALVADALGRLFP